MQQDRSTGNAMPPQPAGGCLQRRFSDTLGSAGGQSAPVAVDPRSQALRAMAARIAASRATVLITGPTGSGKEVMARHIHMQSPRATQPFIAVNCAALPDAMLEALLFGHARGAFTGALNAAPGLFRAADGGTLFLDEIGELPLLLQGKLLRAIQEREVLALGETRPQPVDVRILAATNRDLKGAVAAGQFREDLLWRLCVVPIDLPPLAERPDDIVPLAAVLLARHAQNEGLPIPLPSEAALRALVRHDWPGNVRELENCLHRALLLGNGDRLELADLGLAPAAGQDVPARPDLDTMLQRREAEAIRTALAETGGRRGDAAARLGISERTLRYKLAAIAGRPRGSCRSDAARSRGRMTLQ